MLGARLETCGVSVATLEELLTAVSTNLTPTECTKQNFSAWACMCVIQVTCLCVNARTRRDVEGKDS